MTGQELGLRVVGAVRSYVERAVSPVLERLQVLEERLKELPAGPAGPPGKDGRDGADGKDGRDGIDGKEGPPGRDGVDGKDGAPGIDGRNGEPGRDGKDGIDGQNGKDGNNGRDGIDGKSITVEDVRPILEQYVASWQLDFERRAMDLIHRCIDRIEKPRDGKDGKDGRDALSLEHLSASLREDGRTVDFVFDDGTTRKEYALVFPVIKYRGVWKQGDDYFQGDTVTWGGSSWIAMRHTTSKPETDDSWRLAVKRGRDGRDK